MSIIRVVGYHLIVSGEPTREDALRRYHHIGIPTDIKREGESYYPQLKFYSSGFDTSPFGIEWMRFESDSPVPDLVKSVAHIAFEVDDLQSEIRGKEILIEPNSPSQGVVVAFIIDNGAPVEFLFFSNK